MKTFTFFDDSYFASNGCDCCEDTYMECYNSNDTDCNLGSAHDYESCYYQAILTELGAALVSDEYRDGLYCMNLKELKQIAKDLNIRVKVVS